MSEYTVPDVSQEACSELEDLGCNLEDEARGFHERARGQLQRVISNSRPDLSPDVRWLLTQVASSRFTDDEEGEGIYIDDENVVNELRALRFSGGDEAARFILTYVVAP